MTHYRKMLLVVALLLALGVLACSLGTPAKPSVEILSPPTGTQVGAGEEVEVEYRASDPTAVVRAELEVDGQIVDVQKSPIEEGQPSLTGILRWTASTPGSHSLIVYAHNRARARSDAVGVEITVEEAAEAEPTPTSTAGPTVGLGLLFEDDFSDPAGGWLTGATEQGQVSYEEGELHLLNYTAAEYSILTKAGRTFGDVVVEVETRLVGGNEDNWIGVLCRFVDADNHYKMLFSSDGYYQAAAVVDGEQYQLVKYAASEAIRQGVGETNVVRLECVGSALRFYINGTLLVDVMDATFAEGDIAFEVFSLGGEYSEVAFDNLRAYGPEEAPTEVAPTPTTAAVPTVAPTQPPQPTATATTPSPPTATPAPSYGPVTLSSGFDEEARKPVNPGTRFPHGITELWAYWPYQGVSEGMTYRFDFYHDGSYFYGDDASFDDTFGEVWQWIHRGEDRPLERGTYRLVVKVGGVEVLSAECVIE